MITNIHRIYGYLRYWGLVTNQYDFSTQWLGQCRSYGGGHNESLIGKALGARRDEYVLTTKCGLSREGINGRPEVIAEICDASRKRLGTRHVGLTGCAVLPCWGV